MHEPRLFKEYFEENTPESGPTRDYFLVARNLFIKSGIRSKKDLLESYQAWDNQTKFVCLCIFSHYEYQNSIPLLFEELHSSDPMLSGRASGALSLFGGVKIFNRLVKEYNRCDGDPVQHGILNAIAMMRTESLIVEIAKWLQSLYSGSFTDTSIKARVVYGIGEISIELDRRKRVYHRSVDALMESLNDADAEIRFCAAEALGFLREKRAVSQLRGMIDDHACVYGSQKVSDEVEFALRIIQEENFNTTYGEYKDEWEQSR